jgi:class 3 adenylate cyclase
MLFVVFARIIGIKELPSNQIAGAVETLALVDSEVKKSNRTIQSHSSVYGRFWLVPASVEDAIECARSVREKAAAAGARLGMGVTLGPLVNTQDVHDTNVAGVAINHAARLAFLDQNTDKIALDVNVAKHAIDNGCLKLGTDLGDEECGEVKQTALRYRWLKCAELTFAEMPATAVKGTVAHVVVYDIVAFSKMTQREMVNSVEALRRDVEQSRQAAAGLADWADTNGLWYAPAGDGGVVVFGPERNRVAWSFAKELLAITTDRLKIRIGIATGQVVVVGKNLPVGKGVLVGDELSGLAEVGRPRVNKEFWNLLDPHETEAWLTSEVPGKDCFRIQKRPYASHTTGSPFTHNLPKQEHAPTSTEPQLDPAPAEVAKTILAKFEKLKDSRFVDQKDQNVNLLDHVAKELRAGPPPAGQTMSAHLATYLTRRPSEDHINGLVYRAYTPLCRNGKRDDARIVGEIVDELLPLCIPRTVLSKAHHQLQEKKAVFLGADDPAGATTGSPLSIQLIENTVTEEGFVEVLAAALSGQPTSFKPNATAPVGEQAVPWEDAPIGDPAKDVDNILWDLYVALQRAQIKGDRRGSAGRPNGAVLRQKVSAGFNSRRKGKGRPCYCVLAPPASDAEGKRQERIIAELAIPDLLFIRLSLDSEILALESFIIDCLNTRLSQC